MTHLPMSLPAFQSHFRCRHDQNPYPFHFPNIWLWRIDKDYGRIDAGLPPKSRSNSWWRVVDTDVVETSSVIPILLIRGKIIIFKLCTESLKLIYEYRNLRVYYVNFKFCLEFVYFKYGFESLARTEIYKIS